MRAFRMCWSEAASWSMVAAGGAMTVATARRGDPLAIPVTFGYFTTMEALQGAGYLVVDACGSPANQVVTYLSLLHIVFQPFFINAFAMELAPRSLGRGARTAVFVVCALCSALMLLQLYPFDWAGPCREGARLCGPALCTLSGDWHIAWTAPYNGLTVPFETMLGVWSGFPSYMVAAFALPLLYGAWRFVVFHAVAGPILAGLLTSNPNEMPAIWCLFSIGLLAMGLSPWMRARLSAPGGWGRPTTA